jgi:hypothetical protein
MSETFYKYRVYLIAPDNRKDGLNQFVQAEFDRNDWLLVPLSSSGQEPATHFMCSFACTHEQTSKWAERLTSQGGVPLPAQFSSMTVDGRIAFMESAYPTLKATTGVIVRVCRNDLMPWSLDIQTVLAAEGLQTIQPNLDPGA